MTTIWIRPISDIDDYLLEHLQRELEKAFRRTVEIGPPMPWPDYAYNPERKQYHATSILRRLASERSDKYERVLGVTEADLYLPSLTFVFGEADPVGKAALISVARLRQGYSRLPVDKETLKERVFREAVHELGHTYGILHCHSGGCVMQFSSTLRAADRKGTSFCSNCQKLLEQK